MTDTVLALPTEYGLGPIGPIVYSPKEGERRRSIAVVVSGVGNYLHAQLFISATGARIESSNLTTPSASELWTRLIDSFAFATAGNNQRCVQFTLCSYGKGFDQAETGETGYRSSLHVQSGLIQRAGRSGRVSPAGSAVATPARRLREISDLDVDDLASIFGVTRATYHGWMNGSTKPRSDHYEHLLEVLPLLGEVLDRFGSPVETKAWLMTPVSAGGRKPIDYLHEREYRIFRGAVLNKRTGGEAVRLLTPPVRRYPDLTAQQLKRSLQKIRPREWAEDSEASLDEGDLTGGSSGG